MHSRSRFPGRGSEDHRVLEILEQYLMAQEAGENPDRERIMAAHPDLSARLRNCFESIVAVEQLADGLEPGPGFSSRDQILPEFEDYQLFRELGRGGMGVVYEAEQLSLSRRVALKVLPLAAVFDQTSLQRFRNEALATAQLEHPNIINVYSVGCEKGIHFYSMQLVDGQSLAQVIRALKGLEPDSPAALEAFCVLKETSSEIAQETVRQTATCRSPGLSGPLSVSGGPRRNGVCQAIGKIGWQAASALHHAHQAGMVHRDVKPSNLLLDARGNILVSDFGLATMQGEINLTATGDLLGTLRYMSPEQASGQAERVDHRTDIYSLGATLYELLTCRSVVEGTGRRQVLRNILEENILPPSKIRPSIPRDLETIVMKALSHEREERYTTAWQMAADLRRFLDDQPIRAQRPSTGQRLARWLRRHRWVATTAAVFLLLMVAVSVASSVTIYRWYDKAVSAESELLNRNRELIDALQVNREIGNELSDALRDSEEIKDALSIALLASEKAEAKIEQLPVVMIEKGQRYLELRQFAEAIDLLETALTMDRERYGWCHLWIARACNRRLDFPAAAAHASRCIDWLDDRPPDQDLDPPLATWEAYFERAIANFSGPSLPHEFGSVEADSRFWDLEKLQQVRRDLKFVQQAVPGHVASRKLLAQVTYNLGVEKNDAVLLEQARHTSRSVLKQQPDDRQMIEVSLLALWQLGRHDEFARECRRSLDRPGLATHGHLYLLRSIYLSQLGQRRAAARWFDRGLRWFLHRSPMHDFHERCVRNWLVETCSRNTGRYFDAWNDHWAWTRLYNGRVDSGELVTRSRVPSGDIVYLQRPMNDQYGSLWTPDYKRAHTGDHGAQLFWRPSATSRKLSIAVVDVVATETPGAWFRPGRFRLTANLTSSDDFPIVQFWWNEKQIGTPVDLYHPFATQRGETDLGWVDVVPGRNELTIEIVGSNPDQVRELAFGMDFIDLWPERFRPGRSPGDEVARRLRNLFVRILRAGSAWGL